MQNLIENLPDNINITVTKQDLIDFADYIISRVILDSNESIEKSSTENLQIPKKKVLNIEETSEFIGLTTRTIYKKTSEGLIPHYKQSGKLYFKVDELEEWMTKEKGFSKEEIRKQAANYIMNQEFKKKY